MGIRLLFGTPRYGPGCYGDVNVLPQKEVDLTPHRTATRPVACRISRFLWRILPRPNLTRLNKNSIQTGGYKIPIRNDPHPHNNECRGREKHELK